MKMNLLDLVVSLEIAENAREFQDKYQISFPLFLKPSRHLGITRVHLAMLPWRWWRMLKYYYFDFLFSVDAFCYSKRGNSKMIVRKDDGLDEALENIEFDYGEWKPRYYYRFVVDYEFLYFRQMKIG